MTLTNFGAFHLVSFDGAPFVGMGHAMDSGRPPRSITTTRSPRDRPSPRLVDAQVVAVCVFVLHHELIHATGHRGMTLRSAGGNPRGQAPPRMGAEAFAQMLHMASARWWWTCSGCDVKHARQRRANGRYLCRRCGQVLQDVPAQGVSA